MESTRSKPSRTEATSTMKPHESLLKLSKQKAPAEPLKFKPRKDRPESIRRIVTHLPSRTPIQRPSDPWSNLIMGKSWKPNLNPNTPEYKRAYKQAYWKYTRLVVSLPFLVVTSWILFDRLYNNKQQKHLDPDGADAKKRIFQR
ncbi:hypothetical protein F5Y16DRAFT_397122 [Xylariaceae sp. FL0255]|nr:hypothetical protein F5Y16DRAFT_397122 [Xylariaceae sp. FL0255]